MSGTVKSLREIVSILQEKALKTTLLGIGPMSEVVIRATLELGRDMKFPVMFIASRNQIDSYELGGGYVMGWDQRGFSQAVSKIAKEIDFDGYLYLCRDHGGPWQRDNEKSLKLPEKEAMDCAKASYLADLKAGFNLLHIDPTKDPHIKGAVPVNIVIDRTIELIEYSEEQIQKLDLSAISYEVGTEEITGGLISIDAFEKFIEELLKKLDQRRLPHPAFIVGQTGTLVKMNRNAGEFEPENAQKLCQIAREYGLGFKEHNADYLPLDILRMHPGLEITSANVAPEFGLEETVALLKLAHLEENNAKSVEISNFANLIGKAALESGRWKKWLLPEDAYLTEKDIIQNPEKMKEITWVCGHYVFNQEEIKKARKKLYSNLIDLKIVEEPDTRVIEAVKDAIMKYVYSFSLQGLNEHLKQS